MAATTYQISDLPELPIATLTRGGVLRPSETEPEMTVYPDKPPTPEMPPVTPDPRPAFHCPRSASHYVRRYLTQAIYPKVRCYPNDAPSGEVIAHALKSEAQERPKTSARNLFAAPPDPRYFKLSAFGGAKIANPMFCSVHYGPWSATAIETSACRVDCTILPNRWLFWLPGIPEVALEWYGTWADIPVGQIANLQVITGDLHLVEETTECCSGFIWDMAAQACVRADGPIDNPGGGVPV